MSNSIRVNVTQNRISVNLAQNRIRVVMLGGAAWNGVSGKPTATEENSFMMSGASPFSWSAKTKDQAKIALNIVDEIEFSLINSYRI
jgi:hypothetical protein